MKTISKIIIILVSTTFGLATLMFASHLFLAAVSNVSVYIPTSSSSSSESSSSESSWSESSSSESSSSESSSSSVSSSESSSWSESSSSSSESSSSSSSIVPSGGGGGGGGGSYYAPTSQSQSSSVTSSTASSGAVPQILNPQSAISYISQVLNQISNFLSGNPFAIKPKTQPPTNLQPSQGPPAKTSTKNVVLQIYQKILSELLNLFNLFFPPAQK